MPGGTSECEGGGRRETEPHGGTAKKPATDLYVHILLYNSDSTAGFIARGGGAFAPPWKLQISLVPRHSREQAEASSNLLLV